MNGSQALLRTLAGAGVRICLANPGTSEMHSVLALDTEERLHGVLCLDEAVATGAADGYARMAESPAATLLHLGPGLGNGWTNLHNARRARSPVVNVVGDHATYHKRFDAPLESDVDALARAVSRWVRRSSRAVDVGEDAAEAVAAAVARPGGVATLLLPSDAAWEEGARAGTPILPPPPPAVPEAVIAEAARLLRRPAEVVLLLGGAALREAGLRAASRIVEATGCRALTETQMARCQRGAGRPAFPALNYFVELAAPQLAGATSLLAVDARSPVAFFAYPGRPSTPLPEGCSVLHLGRADQDVVPALESLASRVAAGVAPRLQQLAVVPGVPEPDRPLSPEVAGSVVASLLPEGAVVVDESVTARPSLAAATVGAAPHDWLALVGGAIGEGLPLATGAALAEPGRRVICLEADGSAVYTLSALWTQARERLDVVTIVLSNRAYAILQIEMQRVAGRAPGPASAPLLALSDPDLDFVSLAAGFGVGGARAETAGELARALQRGLAGAGPFLIDARLGPGGGSPRS